MDFNRLNSAIFLNNNYSSQSLKAEYIVQPLKSYEIHKWRGLDKILFESSRKTFR